MKACNIETQHSGWLSVIIPGGLFTMTEQITVAHYSYLIKSKDL